MDATKITQNPVDEPLKNVTPPSKRRRRKRAQTTRNMTAGVSGRGGAGGRQPRTPDPADPKIDARQIKAFELRHNGATLAQIADSLGIARETAAIDIQMEGRRRANELQEVRAANIAMSVARLESVIARSVSRGEMLRQRGISEVRIPDTAATGGVRIERTVVSVKALAGANKEDRNVIAAVKEINMILGLRNEPDVPQRAVNTDAPIIMFINALPPDLRLDALRTLTQQARELGALPAIAGARPT
jgi:transcriptional regulator